MKAILLPLFFQVALTFGLLITLGRSRVSAIASRDVAMKDVALGQDAWPNAIRQIGRSYQSQFELPVLFYALITLAIATDKVDAALIAGAWLFVVSRGVHAFIHLTSNRVPLRFRAFLAGFACLTLMWGYFALRILWA